MLACFIALVGCHQSSTLTGDATPAPTTFPTSGAIRGSVADIQQLIITRGSVTFRSSSGKLIGMDGDSDLTFLPAGQMHMTEYGFAVTEYRGTYSISTDGIVTARFPTFGDKWPDMALNRDATSLFLMPVNQKIGFIFGNRGGAVESSGYWPFRPVPADQEAKVREEFSKQR
jgi:hypothetical protein